MVSHVRLKMDNQTAICHINHMGGTRFLTLSDSACKLWEWCFQRGVILSAEHLPGSSIVIVDRESNNQVEAGQRGLSGSETLWPMQCGRLRFKTELPS